MNEPLYRIQRVATEEAFNQQINNFFRRIFFLPIKKHSKQVYIDYMRAQRDCADDEARKEIDAL